MTVPDDAATVFTAMRLGWSLSEVRGRNRPGWNPEKVPAAAAAAAAAPDWGLDWLPLQNDLTEDQTREEAQALLAKLAADLNVNDDNNPAGSYSSRLETQAAALATALNPPAGDPDQATVNTEWGNLAGLIHEFDGYVQKALVTESETVICGYQLGRALADSYWALNPDLTDGQDHASWSFLLGQKRCSETERLLGRLTAYFHPYTAAAIAGSVEVWKSITASTEWNKSVQADKNWPTLAYRGIYQQIRRWYGLTILKQDPTTLIRPYQLLKDWSLVLRAARLFWFQLVLGLLAAAALAGFAYLLAMPTVQSGLATVLGALGITGIPVAGWAAKLKNDAQSMLARIKEDAYTDLIAVAITTAPEPGQALDPATEPPPPSPRRQAELTRIVRNRRITRVTPTQ
jgi:hypothetical protein